MKRFNVILSIGLSVHGLPKDTNLQKVAEHLDEKDYEDGRSAFPVELLEHGAQLQLQEAIKRAIEYHFQVIHGSEMVEVSPGHSVAKWAIESRRVLKDVKVGVYDGMGATRLLPVFGDERDGD